MTDYDSIVAGMGAAESPMANPIPSAVKTSPDAAARGARIHRATGVDAILAADHLPQLEAEQLQDKWDRIVSAAPKTARFLQNPVAAAISQDDTENLSVMERIVSGMNDLSFRVRDSQRRNKPMDYNDKLFAGGIKPLVTEQDFKDRADKMFASGLFPTRQEAADAVRRQIAGFVKPGESTMAPGKQGVATADAVGEWLSGIITTPIGQFWRGVSQNVGDLMGLDSASAELARQQERSAAQTALVRPDFGGETANAIASGVESAGQQLPAIAAGVASGGAAPTLAYIGAMTYGQSYSKYKGRGASTGLAMLGAGGEALVEVATEKLPMGETLRALESATGGRWKQAATSYLRSQLQEQQGEQAATFLQDAIDTAVANPSKTWADYLAERPDAAYQTMVATLTQSALMAGAGGAARLAGRAGYVPPEQKQLQAEARTQLLEQINQGAAASKVLARDADTFQDFVKQAAEGGPVTDVYIDADVLSQSGLADQVIAASPAAAEQYDDALATGGQVRIPIDEYASRIAPQEYAQQLLDDLRFEPGDMTRREAQVYAQSGALQELESAVASIVGDKAKDDAFTASRDRVKQAVLDNLNALGRFTPQKNELDATLIAARSATRAAQMGITPEEFFNKHVLGVVAQGQAGEQALNQDGGIASQAEGGIVSGMNSESGAVGSQSLNRPDGTDGGSEKRYTARDWREWSQLPEFQDDDNSTVLFNGGSGGYIEEVADRAEKSFSLFDGIFSLRDAKRAAGYGSDVTAFRILDDDMLSQSDIDHRVPVRKLESAFRKASPIKIKKGSTAWDVIWSAVVDDKSGFDDIGLNDDGTIEPGSFMDILGYSPTTEDAAQASWEAQRLRGRLAKELGYKAIIMDDENGKSWYIVPGVKSIPLPNQPQQGQSAGSVLYQSEGKPAEAELAEAKRQLDEQLAIADRMIAERGGLFAPNGEKSKLNRYQWAQVRTANFKEWFGDWEGDADNASKVVDDSTGEPLVVYHGGMVGNVFSSKFSGSGGGRESAFFFTPDMRQAKDYAGSGSIKSVFLDLKNPVETDVQLEPDEVIQAREDGRDGYWVVEDGLVDESEIAVFNPNQIKSATGNTGTFSAATDNILYQPDGDPGPVKRGWFNPSTNTIALLKNADLSTFLHESGHYFLETDISVARDLLRDNAAFGPDTMSAGQQQILRDVSALLKWFDVDSRERAFKRWYAGKVKDGLSAEKIKALPEYNRQLDEKNARSFSGDLANQIDQWDAMTTDQKRGFHEQFAESFERYLLEGKAPSIELQTAFQSFRQWLVSVYKSVRDFLARHPDAGQLNDEVRAVFDRMLATEEEIKLAEQARGMLPLFADAMNAGMTPTEFAEYQKLGVEATQAAIDQLQAQGMRDMKWLNNARSRMLKKLQRQAKAQRAEMRAAARMDVLREPVYQAWNVLTSRLTDEDKLAKKAKRSEAVDPAVDSLFEAIAKMGGLNKEAVTAQWGIDPKDKADAGLFGKPVLRAKDGGRSLDAMVEALTDEGYLVPDENGKGDIAELEEKFKAELRGDRQYSVIKNYEPEALAGQGEDLSGITAARIDRASLDDMEGLPQDVIDRLESLGMTAKTGGIHPDVLSEILPGWTSGDELVRAIAAAQPLKEAIEARTDQWMLEQYADLATPEAVERAADAAIHNDARERFLAAEHKALVKASGDKSQRQLLLSAAREYARQLIGRQKIRDVRPSMYTAAEARAAKAVATSKDLSQKATEKRNQILSGMAAREAYRAQDDTNKGLRYLKKFDSPAIRKRINGDYVDQIEALLEKVDLRKRSLKDIDRRKSFGAFVRSQIEKGIVPVMGDSLLPPNLRAQYLAKVMERNEDGELVIRDDVKQAELLADHLDMAETRSYKDMTVDEFRGLIETIRQIEHLGRKKKSLLTARAGETYEQVRDKLVESVRENSARLPDRLNRTVPSARDEKLRLTRDFKISLRKIGMIMRLLDGNKDGGPMWDFFVRSANERGDWETEEISKASEVLTNALRPVYTLKGGMRGKGVYFESLGRSLNREQRIGLALNVGNDGNLQRLLDGEGWSYADIQPVLQSLTKAEWDAVQAVWDHMDSYRPMIAAIEKRTVGAEPEWVQPVQFTVTTADGQTITLKGGYYPVKYDIEASARSEQLEDATDAKRAMSAAHGSDTTHRSFVKKRSEAVVGRPVELSLSAMYSGVQDVIHDLAWREWLIDASKMINSSTLDDAIRTKYGAETVRAIRQWISDIAAGTRKHRGVFDNAAAFLRKNVASAGLALNVMNAVQNVTGLVNSAERIGAKWLAVGQGELAGSPAHMKEVAAWVDEKSSFMKNRAKTQFRDLNELRNIVENGDGIITKAKQNQFILMTVTQRMVDLPTWIGAYRKAEAEGALEIGADGSIDDSKAVAMADQAVIDAQGSGMTKDLSAVERGGELAKLFTAYYSYMGTTYNLVANRVSGARGGSARERGSATFHVLMVMALPVALMAVIKSGFTPGDDEDWDDPEKLAKKLAMEQASFAMGLVPIAREFTPAIQPFLQDQTFGYQGPSGMRIVGDSVKFTQQASQGEFDDGFRKAAIGLSGSLFGLPAAQINRTWTGAEAMADDKTGNPAALLFGYQERK